MTAPVAARADFAQRIAARWSNTLESVLAAGRILGEAKEALPHGEFLGLVRGDLPFGERTAQMLMRIAADKKITNAQHVSHLPPSWGTLYQLAQLDEASFAVALAEGRINPDMERKDAERLRKAQVHGERLARVESIARNNPPPESLKAPGRRYPVVYADPATKFRTYSALGMEKAADNHYPTMTWDEIAALPVGDLAADDAALFVWATAANLALTLALLPVWRFTYKSQLAWFKTNPDGSPHLGTGYWVRDCHELLLIATRGDIPAPLPGTQEHSCVPAPIGRHSEKPHRFREIIERYFPGVARIELFARERRAGWDAWGNQAGEAA